jgi:GNAT superfamily N-acetyltransferase
MKLESTPFLATEVRGDTAWVGILYVPVDMRRHGLGRALFERWLRTIPTDVCQIRLFSVNLDGEYPTGFWKKLGFEIEGEFSETEIATCYMIRPVDAAGERIPRSCSADQTVSQESTEAAA